MPGKPNLPDGEASDALSNAFPFVSRREVRSRIAEDDAYAVAGVATIQQRHERRLSGEAVTSPCGWMSSHGSLGPKLALKIANGTATEEEIAEAVAMVGRYSKQLALELRTAELQRRPELADVAARFGIGPTGDGIPPTAGAKAQQACPPGRKTRRRPKAWAPEPPPEHLTTNTAALSDPRPHGGCDVCARVLAYLASRRDQRAKDIADANELTTADLATHLRELVGAGVLTKDGHGRGTRYSLP